MAKRASIREFIPSNRNLFLKEKLLTKGAKKSWVKLEPPSIIAVNNPICTAVPPDSTIMAGITVSMSIKLCAKARKPACQTSDWKLFLEMDFLINYFS